jgi:hypothetical protein
MRSYEDLLQEKTRSAPTLGRDADLRRLDEEMRQNTLFSLGESA